MSFPKPNQVGYHLTNCKQCFVPKCIQSNVDCVRQDKTRRTQIFTRLELLKVRLSTSATDAKGPVVCKVRLSVSADNSKGYLACLDKTKCQYVATWDENRLCHDSSESSKPAFLLLDQ